MSLLLDALKKAAQENQNSKTADTERKAGAGNSNSTKDPAFPDGRAIQQEPEQLQELELELHDEVLTLSGTAEDNSPLEMEDVTYEPSKDHRIAPTPSTVTDEALQLLIHKTNHSYKKSRIFTWGGIVITSLLMLTAVGLYFYYDMMTEIETMQRQHQIALASLKAKTRIEENLTSLADVSGSESQVKQEKKPERSTEKTVISPQPKSASTSSDTKTPMQAFSVQVEQKRDPVSEALQRAWRAYHDKDYELSRIEYIKVLADEPKNHDALLGLAAVSLQQDDVVTARDMYVQLLELDPRDPHAHAGLANIAQRNGDDLSEARLKQLIEHRPDDAHLQFALGNLYIQKKSWPEAQQAFFNAWKADRQNPDYAYNLAVSLDHLGKHRAAKAYYEDSLELAAGKNINFSADAVKTRLSYLGENQ